MDWRMGFPMERRLPKEIDSEMQRDYPMAILRRRAIGLGMRMGFPMGCRSLRATGMDWRKEKRSERPRLMEIDLETPMGFQMERHSRTEIG